jgi:hypothetical protein
MGRSLIFPGEIPGNREKVPRPFFITKTDRFQFPFDYAQGLQQDSEFKEKEFHA